MGLNIAKDFKVKNALTCAAFERQGMEALLFGIKSPIRFRKEAGSLQKLSSGSSRCLLRRPKNQIQKKCLKNKHFNLKLVVPFGFEPKAAGLENRCSIQLSYGTN